MIYNAKNGTVKIDDVEMRYISFGHGSKKLVMIPGLGDGLRSVKGMALPFAFMYREFVNEYEVFIFSRKNELEDGYTTRDMARDTANAMQQLGIENADIIGVSQGGMIAQYLAIDYPHLIHKLVLVVTLARQNDIVQNVIPKWIDMAQKNDYEKLMVDNFEMMYTEEYLEKYRKLYPIVTKVGKPKDFQRFLIMANACLTHDAYDELGKISASTYVIGAKEDRVVGAEGSVEIANAIKGARLHMYEGIGHAAYEEADDFTARVWGFLNEINL